MSNDDAFQRLIKAGSDLFRGLFDAEEVPTPPRIAIPKRLLANLLLAAERKDLLDVTPKALADPVEELCAWLREHGQG